MQTGMTWLSLPENLLTLAQVMAALVTAFATWALWRVTNILAVETSELAKMTSNPFVVCYLRSSDASPQAMNLALENTGNATAFDIQLRVTPAPPTPNSKGLTEKDATTFEGSLLPPGKDLVIQAVMSREAYDQRFMVEISWSNRPGNTERQKLEYSFGVKDGFRAGWRTKGLHEIADELEKMRQKT